MKCTRTYNLYKVHIVHAYFGQIHFLLSTEKYKNIDLIESLRVYTNLDCRVKAFVKCESRGLMRQAEYPGALPLNHFEK